MSEKQKPNINTIDNKKENKDLKSLYDFLNELESKPIVTKNQEILDNKNSKTTDSLNKNIKHTRDDVNVNLNIGITDIYKERGAVTIIEKKPMLINVNTIKNSNGVNVIEKTYSTPKGYDGDYSDALGNMGNITDYEPNLENNRNLSEEQRNLLDAIKNQTTKEDINMENEIIMLIGKDDLSEEQRKTISPLDILKDKYQDASEDKKIELAKVMSRYMAEYGYDNENSNNGNLDNGDVSSEEIWETYKKGGVAGVCRHHHSEVAKFLKSVGFETGMVTTNNGGRHAVTWLKKQDGTFGIVDYGGYSEGKDPKELKARYFASVGALDIKEWVTDENGKVIGNIQTDLEKTVEETTSSIGTGDSLNYSKGLAKEGINIIDGQVIDINLDTEKPLGLDYKYGNGNIEGGVFYEKFNDLDYANYTSYGLYGNAKIGDRKGELGELGVGVKISENKIDWGNHLEKKYRVLGGNIEYSKELYNNGITEVGIGGVLQRQIMQDIEDSKGDKNFGIIDETMNFGISLDGKHKINPNLEGSINLGYGGDVGIENVRISEKVKVYDKKSIGVGLEYLEDDGDRYSFDGAYEKGLGYSKIGGNLNVEKGDFGASVGYEKIDNSKNPFLLDEVKINSKAYMKDFLVEDVTLTIGAEKIDNGVSSDKRIKAGFEYKF